MDNRLSYWMGTSLRLGIDFVTSILVGVFIGRGIDYYFDSHPFGLVIFILFGIIAGSLTVYRSTKKIMFGKQPSNLYED